MKNQHLLGNLYGAKSVVDLQTGKAYESLESLARELGVKANTLSQKIRRDKTGRFVKLTKPQADNFRKVVSANDIF